MATNVNKIDSNATSLAYAQEQSIGVLPGSPTWQALEPNSYPDFGGNITTVARDPINASRQRKKGVTTDLEASMGFVSDITPTNIQDLMQGVFFADLDRKAEYGKTSGNFTGVTTGPNTYTAASGLSVFKANDLILAEGFTNTANNGLKRATAAASGVLTVAETLVAETPAAGVGSLVQVGFQFAVGDAAMTSGLGSFPTLTTTTKDLTEFGLEPGEWVFIGDDTNALYKYTDTTCNGWFRIRSVAAHVMTFDKSNSSVAGEAAGTKTIRVFFGRLLKNRLTSSTIVRRSYQFERTLGVPDTGSPSQVQSEYVVGTILNEWQLDTNTADKLMCTFTGLATDSEQRTGAEMPKSNGILTAVSEEDAFNTSSDVSRFKMNIVSATDSCPAALFSFMENLTISVNNNASLNKAVGTLGAFDITVGTFQVSASVRGYFQDISSIEAVRNNSDVTMDIHYAKSVSKNSLGSTAIGRGISFDIPLASLGDGRPDVQKDTAIMQPITLEAGTASKIDSTLDYTAVMIFWDYLPSMAL